MSDPASGFPGVYDQMGNRAEQPNVLCAVLVRSGSGGEAWHETRVLDEEPFLGGEDGGDGGELGVGDASALGASEATLGDASTGTPKNYYAGAAGHKKAI
ncbi:hypothetical protein EMIHUDRAFT_210134 [Emiliania huxleyi CCMP1516]|uniref:Uncharacterized protein n=2 Tax=Emiliania huxleyi TaxID=2903 RepID=A0A0D3J1P2_EMIH1|nr:hypothetical protein EMIHUDRAFT_210134 [Emiliania huxleyi CCMP1516]EOD17427.1 hypothetical protein EMIHUDRAFT_210134 [Emiliania huxleyi CCMP1516]|eukprot:XP_005769856.1 hypothetical protein EMIHUDRAFT_210134 [Emiliania huxleyi CCMP1516]